jgi:FF domain
MSRGIGRGKSATLPAWMTAGEGASTSQAIPIQPSSDNSRNIQSSSTSSTYNGSSQPPLMPTVPVTASSKSFSVPPPPVMATIVPTFIPPVPVPVMQSIPPAFHFQPPPQVYPGPSRTTAIPPPPASTGDPNNEVANWSVHQADDGQKFWFNKVTNVSTYDKPFCLKTPEERSIPPCRWKEYTSNGQKYYSDGVDSVWEEPAEFREWREKIEAAVAKASAPKIGHHTAPREDSKKKSVAVPVAVNYATTAEATEAFYELLDEKKISAVARNKDIKDLCQDDPRWNALKSSGERNQAIAEYQTKKLKIEKETKMAKLRKQKDAFLVMSV